MTALLESMGSFPTGWLQRVRQMMPEGPGNGPFGRQNWPLNVARGVTLLALVIFAAWIVAGLVWDVTVPTDTAGTGGASLAGSSPATTASGGAGQNTPQLSFFGVGAQADAPVSSGPYTLSGLMVSTDPSKSRAIIRNGQSDKVYAVGDKLPNGQTIAAIETDRVIVQTSGGREALLLPKPEMGGRPPAALNTNTGVGGSVGGAPATAPGDAALALLRAPATIQRTMLSKEALVSQFGALKVAVVNPGTSTGGLKIVDIANSPILRAMGLRDGDVVSQINGTALTGDAQSFAAALATLATASSASVVINRNGVVTRKTINIVGK